MMYKKSFQHLFRILLLLVICSSVCYACTKDNEPAKTPVIETYDSMPFANVPALNDMVIYEVNTPAYSSAGTFKGVTQRLDSIKALGVNVIWLMPIYPIGTTKGVGSPYCVADYLGINPNYGTLKDLRELVKTAHSKNMAVILDWVANHTSWDHPWIKNHPDWYKQDASGNIVTPNKDWLDVAQINASNADMRLEMIKSMKYWINNANIDGFRCDAIDFLPMTFWKQTLDSLYKMPGRNLIMLGEGGMKENFGAGFKMNYSWDFESSLTGIFKGKNAASNIFTTDINEYKVVPAGSLKLRYITNHDLCSNNSLITNFLSKEGTVAAFVITSFMSGVPLIYTGQEVAYPVKLPFMEGSIEVVSWTENLDITAAYKKIMQVRSNLQSVKKGTLKSYADNDVVVFKRILDNEEVLVLVNTRDKAVSYSIPEELNNSPWANLLNNSTLSLSGSLSLQPFEYLILKK